MLRLEHRAGQLEEEGVRVAIHWLHQRFPFGDAVRNDEEVQAGERRDVADQPHTHARPRPLFAAVREMRLPQVTVLDARHGFQPRELEAKKLVEARHIARALLVEVVRLAVRFLPELPRQGVHELLVECYLHVGRARQLLAQHREKLVKAPLVQQRSHTLRLLALESLNLSLQLTIFITIRVAVFVLREANHGIDPRFHLLVVVHVKDRSMHRRERSSAVPSAASVHVNRSSSGSSIVQELVQPGQVPVAENCISFIT